MLSLVQDGAAPTRSAPPEAELRAELTRLNVELKELKSTDFAVRAYIETWIATIGILAWCKLVYDWQRTHSHAPWLIGPLAMLSVVVFVDSLVQRAKQRRLACVEDAKLRRQRELRTALGIDDAVFPATQAATAA